MVRKLLAGSLFAGLIPFVLSTPVRPAGADDSVRIAPASGGVEIDGIHIERRSALGAVRGADLTNTRLDLWFPADWKDNGERASMLVHLRELDGIEDDTGRLLSTETRLRGIEELKGEVRQNTTKGGFKTGGPVVHLKLDAPSRGADKLKAIKGEAEVTLAKKVVLTFNDLAAIDGTRLEHPDLKALRDMNLVFSVSEKGGTVSARLSAPENFTSPWRRGRLQDWDVMDGDEELRPSSIGGAGKGKGEGVTEEKTYRERTTKGLSLRLTVLEAVETKTFKFHFKDVDLP